MSGLRIAGGSESGQMLDGVHMSTNIALRLVDELLPYSRNSKTHSPAQVELLANNIKRFGWTNPCLIADGVLIAGHGRLLAAKKLGLSRVPCIDLSHLDEASRRALVISDNRISEVHTGWDLEALRLETDDLRALGFDLEADLGFAEEDLADMFSELDDDEPGPGNGDPDAIPEPPAVPHSIPGDIWVCGPHRVACGDSLSPATWDALLGSESADLCITDPPYNVDIGDKNRRLDMSDRGNRAKSGGIKNDKMSNGDFRAFLKSAYDAMFTVMKPGAPIYVAHADIEGYNFRGAFLDAGFKMSGCLIWRKNMFTLGRADYQWKHEPVLYGWKPGAAHKWYGGRKRTTIIEWGESGPVRRLEDGRWAITVGDTTLVVDGNATIEEHPGTIITHDKPQRSELHPTTKPVGLWETFMRPSSRKGDVVIDPFLGSGTTLIAAERMGLVARVCDLDPKHVDTAVRRWEDYTGLRAVHAVTGAGFPRGGEERVQVPPIEPTESGQDIF